MNERIRQLAEQAKEHANHLDSIGVDASMEDIFNQKFAELIVQECIDKIETYHIPVGNSAAGEMACGMTYDALKEIRDEIREHFEVENE
jgi:FAD synthase